MKLTETIPTAPLQAMKSVRGDEIRAITSAKAGKTVPLAYAPLLREDRVSRGRVRVSLEAMEMAETLMTGIHVDVMAHFIPFLAFERFNGLDQLNRSYQGVPETEGGAVVPFFETIAYDRNAELFKTMGLHAKDGAMINSAVVEAYNALVNFRRRARSAKLPQRLKGDTTLSNGFWVKPGMMHIVPDFDQAMIDGEVTLNLNGSAPVSGIWTQDAATSYTYAQAVTQADGTNQATTTGINTGVSSDVMISRDEVTKIPQVFAEMQNMGVQLSLQNIELAKKTAAFAAIKKQMNGIDDEYIIDLLMDAVRVPDEQLSQPILLDRKRTMFGYSKRYATDSANLDKSVTTGVTMVELNLRTPPMNTGGIILITCEICPEQMYERQKDAFLHLTATDGLPHYTRDYLDPEKVDIVSNDFVDVEHTVPDATFGYAPLNHVWQRSIPRIGGKFHRKLGDPFDENRQRIWSVETIDPALTEDFYLAGNLHHNVFSDTLSDPFEITTLGQIDIVGNTVFGKRLEENTNDYGDLMAGVDTGRIDQTV